MGKIYKLQKNLIIGEVGDEVLIVSGADKVYVLKNAGAKELYKLLSKGVSLEQLTDMMHEEEDKGGILSLMARLKEEGLIEEVEGIEEKLDLKIQGLPELEVIKLKELVPEELLPVGCVSIAGTSYVILTESWYECTSYSCDKDCKF